MKTKIILIGISLCLSVFAAGCLIADEPYISDISYNSSYQTTEFQRKGRPTGDNISYLLQGANISFWYGDQKQWETTDLIVYATVKEIKPSQWLTSDGKEPDGLTYTTNPATGITYCTAPYTDRNKIGTDIIFTVDEWAKGTSSDEIVVYIRGGQVGNVVFEYNDGQYGDTAPPSPWDFEVGEKYLLYLEWYTDSYHTYNGSYQLYSVNSIYTVVN